MWPGYAKRAWTVRDEPVEREEHRPSDGEPTHDLGHGAPVEGWHEQAEGGGREHDAGREPEEAVEQPVRRLADGQEPEPTDAGCEPGAKDPEEGLEIHERRRVRPKIGHM